MDKKIILLRPHGYAGGIIIIDALCKSLREQDIDARLLYTEISDNTKIKDIWKCCIKDFIKLIIYKLFKSCFDNSSSLRSKAYRERYTYTMNGLKRQLFPFFSKEKTIVLYPEIIKGNCLHAKHVVRWLLYYNHYKNDPNAYGDNDFFICYRKQFNDWDLNPKGLTVTINYFNSQLYRQYNFGERKGNCYILRKGHYRQDLPNGFDGPAIDTGMEEEEIVRIFNTTKYCYSYDTQTFYCTIAAVCGCIPIVVLEEGKTIHDYLSEEEVKNNVGIAWGDSPDEIQHAIDTREQLLHRLDYSQKNEENTKKFIQYITEKFD